MGKNKPGITFRETMAGAFALNESDPQIGEEQGEAAGTTFSLRSTITIDDVERFIADPNHQAELAGEVDFAPFGENIPTRAGLFNLFSPTDKPELKLMVYEFIIEHAGQDYYFAGQKNVHDDPGFDLWADTTTLLSLLHQGADKTGPIVGAGILRLGLAELMKVISTIQVTQTESAKEQSQAVLDFGRFFLGELWDSYAGPA